EDRRVTEHDHVTAEPTGGSPAQDDLGPDPRRIADRDRDRSVHDVGPPTSSTRAWSAPNPPERAMIGAAMPSTVPHDVPGASEPWTITSASPSTAAAVSPPIRTSAASSEPAHSSA